MRRLSTFLAAALWLLAVQSPLPVRAQTAGGADYPTKPIHLVVTFPPGGSTDAAMRIIAPRLSERLGQQVLIENKGGAGGNIGLTAVAQAPADGYTLGIGAAGGLAVNASLYPKMPFDTARDFVPVSLVAHIPFVLVANPALNAKDLADMLAMARADPGKLSIGHGGNGTAMHLSTELLKQMAKVNFNTIAYRGSGPATIDVLGGQTQLAMLDMPSCLAQVKAGKLKALAVTGSKRSVFLPDVPTMAEAGVAGYESTGWFGLVAPAATPPAVLRRLQTELRATLLDPQVINGARAVGVELTPSTAAEFERFIRSETQKWAEVVKTSGTRLE